MALKQKVFGGLKNGTFMVALETFEQITKYFES